MYSYKDRLKAVKLYIIYDLSCSSVIHELGYLNNQTLKVWYKEYQTNGNLHKTFINTNGYNNEQHKAATDYYIQHWRNTSRTIRVLGYSIRQRLHEWIKQDHRFKELLNRVIKER
jgi:hypothetical protein